MLKLSVITLQLGLGKEPILGRLPQRGEKKTEEGEAVGNENRKEKKKDNTIQRQQTFCPACAEHVELGKRARKKDR